MTTDAEAPIARPTVSVPVKLDADGRLDEDISCRKCGYNLHGLSPEGRCPECGTAAERSLRGDLLRFAEPQWVRGLASGMNRVAFGLGVGWLVIIIISVLPITRGLDYLWFASVSFCFRLIVVIGSWKVTRPDPAKLGDASKLSTRRLTRVALLTGVALSAVQPLAWRVSLTVGEAGLLVGDATDVVGIIAAITCLRQLAGRIPDVKIAKRCTTIMRGMVTFSCGNLLLSLVVAFTGSSGTIVNRLSWLLGTGCFVFFVWGMLIILRLRTAFKEAARFAAATWAAAPPPA